MMRRIGFALVAIQFWAGTAQAQDATVVTSLRPLHSIVETLAEGTRIEVVNVPDKPTSMASLDRSLGRAGEALTKVFQRADAVVTLRSVWPQDPLYPRARAVNIRIVEIDAGSTVGGAVAGVALLDKPVSDVPWRTSAETTVGGASPFVWLSISNVQRMAEIIADDLERLVPEETALITRNLEALKSELRVLRAEADARTLEIDDLSVFALSDQFDYLLADLGLLAVGHFLEQGAFWSAEDYAGLTHFLTESRPGAVVHHWDPEEEVSSTLDAAGVRLVVLDSAAVAGGGAEGASLTETLSNNVAALLTALDDGSE